MIEARKYLSYLLYHLKRRIVWIKKWVILVRPVAVNEPVPAAPTGYTLRQAEIDDYPALIAAYPAEFSSHLPEAVKRRQLMQRARGAARCYLIADENGLIKGACWCAPYKNPLIKPEGIDQNTLFEMMNTFIVQDARGKGLSEVLRRFAIASMASEGYRAVISFVWYSRAGSLKMNLNTGSRVLGEKTLYSVMGRRWSRFRPHVAVNRLPVPFNGVVFFLGSGDAPFCQFTDELKPFGIRSVVVITGEGLQTPWRMRLHGLRTIDRREQTAGTAFDLPEPDEGSANFLVALDTPGTQLLAERQRIGLPPGWVPVGDINAPMAEVNKDCAALPMAVLKAAGLDDYFHRWSERSREDEVG